MIFSGFFEFSIQFLRLSDLVKLTQFYYLPVFPFNNVCKRLKHYNISDLKKHEKKDRKMTGLFNVEEHF